MEYCTFAIIHEMKVKFQTGLSQSVCKGNISSHADESFWYTSITNTIIPGNEIEYKFHGNKFKLKKVRPYMRNALKVTFFGEFVKGKEVNYINGTYRMNKFGVVFITVWEISVICAAISIFIKVILPQIQSLFYLNQWNFTKDDLTLLIPLLMPLFGYAMYRFSKEIANSDIKIMNAFIEKHCNAVQIKSSQSKL